MHDWLDATIARWPVAYALVCPDGRVTHLCTYPPDVCIDCKRRMSAHRVVRHRPDGDDAARAEAMVARARKTRAT